MIEKTSVITGLLFKKREPAGYALLVEELAKHGGRYLAIKSHAKITLLGRAAMNMFLVIETSANLSTNNKVEQTTVFNDQNLYQWYKIWFEDMFEKNREGRSLW